MINVKHRQVRFLCFAPGTEWICFIGFREILRPPATLPVLSFFWKGFQRVAPGNQLPNKKGPAFFCVGFPMATGGLRIVAPRRALLGIPCFSVFVKSLHPKIAVTCCSFGMHIMSTHWLLNIPVLNQKSLFSRNSFLSGDPLAHDEIPFVGIPDLTCVCVTHSQLPLKHGKHCHGTGLGHFD